MNRLSPSWPWPRIFAHRCGGKLAPENTITGVSHAERLGCGVEFDVRLSADGTPFVIHDETLERTTNGTGRVSETSDRNLERLDAGAAYDPSCAGEPIPRLHELLLTCTRAGIVMNIELKADNGREAATARAVAGLLASIDPPPAVIVSSFSETALEAFAHALPAIPRGLLVEVVPSDWSVRCRRLGVSALHVESSMLTRDVAQEIRCAGLCLVVYTEDDPSRMQKLFAWGVDCIITDRPDLMQTGSHVQRAHQ